MPKRRVLVQWIGHTDLRSMAVDQPAAAQKKIMERLGGQMPKEGNVGPIKTLLQTQNFDEVRFLSNYQADWNKRFVSWLGVKATAVKVELEKPTDYVSISLISQSMLFPRSCEIPTHTFSIWLPKAPARSKDSKTSQETAGLSGMRWGVRSVPQCEGSQFFSSVKPVPARRCLPRPSIRPAHGVTPRFSP